MHIAVHPANNKDDDEDEDGKDDDDNEEEEQEQDVVASNTSPQGHAFKTQLINLAESENKITRRGSFKAKTVTDLLFCLSTSSVVGAVESSKFPFYHESFYILVSS